MSRHSE